MGEPGSISTWQIDKQQASASQTARCKLRVFQGKLMPLLLQQATHSSQAMHAIVADFRKAQITEEALLSSMPLIDKNRPL